MPLDDENDDSLEFQPIERRGAVRGSRDGMTATVLEGSPLANQAYETNDFGLESLFLKGEVASQAVPGDIYRLLLTFGDETVECEAECVRTETDRRVGCVLRLAHESEDARSLFAAALGPSGIPQGSH